MIGSFNGRDEIKLICGPYFGELESDVPDDVGDDTDADVEMADVDDDDADAAPGQGQDQVRLKANRSYDLMGLATWTPAPAGVWRFQLELVTVGKDLELILKRSRKTRAGGWAGLQEKKYPLYYDAGKNCVYVGERNKTLDEAMAERGGPW